MFPHWEVPMLTLVIDGVPKTFMVLCDKCNREAELQIMLLHDVVEFTAICHGRMEARLSRTIDLADAHGTHFMGVAFDQD